METHYLAAVLDHHHLTYGWLNPAMGLAFAAAGSFLGLSAAHYARAATTAISRIRWALLASLAIGGIGIWMMHFVAMIGFTVTGSDIAYDAWLTVVSFALAVLAVGIGVFLSGTESAGWPRLVLGGLVCGAGVVGAGVAAMTVRGGGAVAGIDPLVLMVPILLPAIVTIAGLVFGVLSVPNLDYRAKGPDDLGKSTVRLADASRP
ncbi:MHYT domain-containing protein [Glycomyces tarimensis]